jgi:hypothetical protein
MVSTILAVIQISIEGGGDIKNWRGKIWEVPSDHNTTRIYKGGPREKNFQKKKWRERTHWTPYLGLPNE